MRVQDAMRKQVTWVPPTALLSEISKKMREFDIGAIPVGENDRLIGMVTDRDIATRAFSDGRDARALTARDVMSKGITYCRESEELEDAARIMQQKQVRRLPVLNDSKRMVGILSLGDISHAASQDIVGKTVGALTGHHSD